MELGEEYNRRLLSHTNGCLRRCRNNYLGRSMLYCDSSFVHSDWVDSPNLVVMVCVTAKGLDNRDGLLYNVYIMLYIRWVGLN